MSKSTILVLTGVVLTATYAIDRIRRRHHYLKRHVYHKRFSTLESSSKLLINSLPAEIVKSPESFHIIHDRDSIDFPVLKPGAPQTIFGEDVSACSAPEAFTRLVRRNMTYFAYWTPQGWMIWLAATLRPSLGVPRHTFAATYLANADFQPGDIICGVYEVCHRTETSVEFRMRMPKGMEGVNGMLVLRWHPSASDGNSESNGIHGPHPSYARLKTETLQWTIKGSGIKLPLEQPFPRYLHELAAWGLLVSGAEYLQNCYHG